MTHPVAKIVLDACEGDKDKALDELARLAWGAVLSTSSGYLRVPPSSVPIPKRRPEPLQ